MPEDSADRLALARVRYGATHAARVQNALWEQSMRETWSGYGMREHLGAGLDGGTRFNPSFSSYRETMPGPFWSWMRYGRTSTPLPDGRVVHIAGEHEDWYDPDFCIYNDVVVEYPDGRREFYLYPKKAFPPTDFHSATLVGDEIVLVGSLGYQDMRRVGETQVLKLDTRTLQIRPIATTGEGPGWISRHTAEQLGKTAILVIGGDVATAQGLEPNRGSFELDLTTMTWRRREHGDVALFPIAHELYRANRNPRYGGSNPERSDNPFWLEMARRRWPPSRARQHFGDFAPPEPETIMPREPGGEIVFPKLERTIDDVVWTAVREHAHALALPDGRKLLIGGEITDYGDEYADPWVYNDVIVTHPDGAIEILTYPQEVFPHLSWGAADVVVGADVHIFGIIDRDRHPDRSRGPAILRLNTSTYEIAPIPAPDPSARANVYRGSGVPDGRHVVFPVVRHSKTDPIMRIAFDLATLTWGEPFRLP